MAAPKTQLFQSRTKINAGTVKGFDPVKSSHDVESCSLKAIPKEGVNMPQCLPSDDLMKCCKLIEENGQKFVRFECIRDFDLYFETLCRSRGSNEAQKVDISVPRDDYESQDKVSDSCSQSQIKELVEDEDFIYFKDEDDLRSFLKPYFEDATRNVQVFSTSDVVERPPLCTNQDPSCVSETSAKCDAIQVSNQETYQLQFDGASKGNPGPAGAGALIRCPHGEVILEVTEFVGTETNNVAEYRSLIRGLKAALSKGIRRIRAQGDSKLVCLQVAEIWRVQDKLRPLQEEARRLASSFEVFSIDHVRRGYNSAADALANEAVYLGESEPVREVQRPQPNCCHVQLHEKAKTQAFEGQVHVGHNSFLGLHTSKFVRY